MASGLGVDEEDVELRSTGQPLRPVQGRGGRPYLLEGLPGDDFAVAYKKLRGTLFRTADYRDKAIDLPSRNQAEHAARRAGQHGPVGIFLLADFAGVFQHKDGSGLHVFRDPLVDQIQFADHIVPLLNQTLMQILYL
jgi:hypothetical protein